MVSMTEAGARLTEPFAAEDIEWRVQSETRKGDKVRVLAYVTNRAIQQRLDDVFGVFGWQNEFIPGPAGGIVCRLRVRNPDTGEWVTKEDGAENTAVEAVKGGMSSAMKRTAVHLGIGRYLYKLGETYAPLKERGDNWHKAKDGGYRYWDTPRLPRWALPKRKASGEFQGLLKEVTEVPTVMELDDVVSVVRDHRTLTDEDKQRLLQAADARFQQLQNGKGGADARSE